MRPRFPLHHLSIRDLRQPGATAIETQIVPADSLDTDLTRFAGVSIFDCFFGDAKQQFDITHFLDERALFRRRKQSSVPAIQRNRAREFGWKHFDLEGILTA